MTTLTASVSRYSLTVDAAETITVLAENADNPWGRRLDEALRLAMFAESAYPVAPYAPVSREDFHPDAPKRSGMPDVAAQSVSEMLDNLQDAGYVTVHNAWRETSSETYLSDGRIVTAVHVVRPFALVTVKYSWSREANRRVIATGYGSADRWEIADRSYTVPAGWYLVGEIGDYNMFSLVGVAGINEEHTDWACWLYGLEGFGASYCAARCQSCGARWLAYGDSWHFTADECDADAWDFEEVQEIDETTGTIACPACGTGRVGFDIF